MQKYFISFLLGGLLVAGIALADHGEETGTRAVDPAEVVTSMDLGVEDPGTLPTSRLYFFKEFGRGIQSFFTFNTVKKAELELRFANEKAAEAKEVQETQPNNERGITKALENYQKSQERLKLRFETLRDTSENPNVDKLLEQLAEKTVKHEKLFDNFEKKFENHEEVLQTIKKVKEKIEESAAAGAAKDDTLKFTARLEKAFIESKGSELKHVRSLEILDRISKKAPEDLKDSIEKLRKELSERVKEDIEEVLKTRTPEVLTQALENLPGDAERRIHLVEELQEKANREAARALKNATEAIEKTIKAEKRIVEKAMEQIEDAAERIEKLQKEMGEFPTVSENVLKFAATAKEHLGNARKAFEERKFGEAFGQARSAESAARNALRILEELEEAEAAEAEEVEDVRAELQEDLRELDLKIQQHEALAQDKGFTPAENPEAFKLLEQAKQHLGFADDSLTTDGFEGTKLHGGHVKGFLRTLSRLIERKESQNRERVLCIEGMCEEQKKEPSPESSVPQGQQTLAVFSVEADDNGFYPSPEIKVPKGVTIALEFKVRSQGVYFGGLDFRSDKFKTGTVLPGKSARVEFTADEPFEFTSWWPASQRLKATGKVIVE